MKELAQKLINYHLWANKRIIEHLKTLPNEIFTKETDNVFSSISQTLGHVLSVDKLWLSRIKSENPNEIFEQYFSSIEVAENIFNQLAGNLKGLLLENEVTKKIWYQNTKGVLFQQPIFEIIQHVVNHGTYHRGNISAMIRQLGYHGTSTDYITFLRQQ